MRNQRLNRSTLCLMMAVALASQAVAHGSRKPSPPPMPPQFPSAPPSTDFAPDIVRGSNALGIDLWRQLDRQPGNRAISPASISAALAMTWYGAKGMTAAQFASVMHLSIDAGKAGQDWGRLIPALENPLRRTTLRIADRVYAQKDFRFEPSFLDWSHQAFGAGLDKLDFAKAPGSARGRINAWVDERTLHHIRGLLPPGAISSSTRMVLVNAIYFMGAWQDSFDEQATAPAAFFLTPTERHDVQTMHQTTGLAAAQVDGAKVLALDYKGDSVQMLFVLPDKVDGLADLERNMGADSVDGWSKSLAWKPIVIVSLPRFRIEPSTPVDLVGGLSALGMTDAFDRKRADFTGIGTPRDPKNRLVLGHVMHEASVTVDEQGAEAEAATAVIITETATAMPVGEPPPPPPPFVFNADHPFLFVIRDRASGLILFIGHVTDPGAP